MAAQAQRLRLKLYLSRILASLHGTPPTYTLQTRRTIRSNRTEGSDKRRPEAALRLGLEIALPVENGLHCLAKRMQSVSGLPASLFIEAVHAAFPPAVRFAFLYSRP